MRQRRAINWHQHTLCPQHWCPCIDATAFYCLECRRALFNREASEQYHKSLSTTELLERRA